MLWCHNASPYGPLVDYIHFLCCSCTKSFQRHPWMLWNFILVPHSWTWRPARSETGEWNTTHHKPWLPVCKKGKKRRKKSPAEGTQSCWHCYSLLWCCLCFSKYSLHIDQAFCHGVMLLVYTPGVSCDISMILNVYSIQGVNLLSSFNVQEPWKNVEL